MGEESWKLWAAVGALMFAGGFLFIFFFGAQVDYTPPGQEASIDENFLKQYLPSWMFPPTR